MEGPEGAENLEVLISASKLEKYGYCPLSWWLSRDEADEELDSTPLVTGAKAHEKVSDDLTGIVKGEKIAKEFESVVLWFAIAATLISVMGISLVFRAGEDIGQIMGVIALIWILAACYFLYKAETIAQKRSRMIYQRIILIFAIVATLLALNSVTLISTMDPNVGKIAQAISLAWLIAACYFLYRSLKHLELAGIKRRKQRVRHDITYIDSEEKKPKLFTSKRYGLSGRPDFVLLVGDEHVPVELKTGRVPRGPLFSHILQVAAYCVLLEEEFGKPPPHGIIRYGQVENEVEYDEGLKELVLNKIAEMRRLMKTGNAHRNHNKPGKCKNCSRRAVCPERLD
jgi:CRISPR-associated exonuclease Cas4